ncbi:hypothetical protein H7Y40_01360 [Pedobacter sp.]|nr:hypothetical protein [Candidatus Saccharibacteria bacterium]
MDSAIMFLFISVVIIGIVLVIIINLTRKSPHALDKQHYQEQWLSIEQSVGTDNGSMQFAIVQADKLLDKALKERGFAGQTMGERMKSAQKNMTNPDAVWAAHKIRNRIAHEDSMTVGRKQTLQALQGLKRALRDLGAL